jgi:hypothetical protein
MLKVFCGAMLLVFIACVAKTKADGDQGRYVAVGDAVVRLGTGNALVSSSGNTGTVAAGDSVMGSPGDSVAGMPGDSIIGKPLRRCHFEVTWYQPIGLHTQRSFVFICPRK